MPSKKRRIDHAPIVKLFAARLRERGVGAGLTLVTMADRAGLAANYVGRLEAAMAAPGIDTVRKLATALGTTVHHLLPIGPPPDPLAVLQGRGRELFDELLRTADRDLMLLVVPFLARLVEAPARGR